MNILKTNTVIALFLVLVVVLFPGCKDDTPDPILIVPEVKIKKRSVLIANQGNGGDGSLSIYETLSKEVQHLVYEPYSSEVTHHVYQKANGEKLGGTLVALTKIEDEYYFVLQDIGKIIVTDSNFLKLGEILDLKSPTQIYKVGTGKGYVTSSTAKYITVVDLFSNEKSGVIGTGAEVTTGVVKDSSFVCLVPSQDIILEINAHRDSVVDRVTLTGGMQSIFLDNNDLIRIYIQPDWSMVTWWKSNDEDNFVGALLRGRPREMLYSSSNDRFYYLNKNDNSIWESEVEYRSARSNLHIEVDVVPELHSLGRDFTNGEFYTSYEMEGSDSTRVIRFSEFGKVLDEFSVPSKTSNFFFP